MKYKQAVGFMAQAFVNAHQSHAERRKAGAMVIEERPDKRHRTLSNGYNGTRPGTDNRCEDSDGVTLDYDTVIHAERNALEKLSEEEKQNIEITLFITRYPCPLCADMIREFRVKHVYYCESSDEPCVKHGDLGNIPTTHIPKEDIITVMAEITLGLAGPKFK